MTYEQQYSFAIAVMITIPVILMAILRSDSVGTSGSLDRCWRWSRGSRLERRKLIQNAN